MMPNCERIEIIGTRYNSADMMIDTVEQCAGFSIRYDKYEYIFNQGDKYKDGKIVDCFVHPESSCAFIVVECSGVYFCVYFSDYSCAFDDELPFR